MPVPNTPEVFALIVRVLVALSLMRSPRSILRVEFEDFRSAMERLRELGRERRIYEGPWAEEPYVDPESVSDVRALWTLGLIFARSAWRQDRVTQQHIEGARCLIAVLMLRTCAGTTWPLNGELVLDDNTIAHLWTVPRRSRLPIAREADLFQLPLGLPAAA